MRLYTTDYSSGGFTRIVKAVDDFIAAFFRNRNQQASAGLRIKENLFMPSGPLLVELKVLFDQLLIVTVHAGIYPPSVHFKGFPHNR